MFLSRHGQTVWHAENRYAGVSDIDLTPTGREQARRLAAWCRQHRPTAVVSSPVRRAVETAAPSARVLGVEPVVLDDLREVNFGIAEGRTLRELEHLDPGAVHRFRSDPVRHHFAGGEPSAQAAVRAERALRWVARRYAGATVLVVAHNTLIRLALCQLLGLEISRYRTLFPRLDNGTLTEVSLSSDGEGHAALHSLNVPLAGGHAVTPNVGSADGHGTTLNHSGDLRAPESELPGLRAATPVNTHSGSTPHLEVPRRQE
jgi:probable phosphoglycerate mutase